MKISLVTISFNQAPFLRACIDSVLSQDHPNFEYIVVDPGSTDGSREIIESYGERIVRVFEADQGPADGLNRGFSRATGDVFAFINSDDVLLPNALRAVDGAFGLYSHADVICGSGFYINKEGTRVGKVTPSKMHPWLYAYGAVTLFQQGMFFRREAFQRVGGFNVENRTSWDGELFLDMAMQGSRFVIVPKALAEFRLHGESITVSGRFAAAQKRDSKRLFARACGRPLRRSDAVIGKVARLAKFVVDPKYILRRGLRPAIRF